MVSVTSAMHAIIMHDIVVKLHLIMHYNSMHCRIALQVLVVGGFDVKP